MEDGYYSISEIAEKLNITSGTVSNKIKSLKKELKPFKKQIMGRTFIQEEGIDIINIHIDRNKCTRFSDKIKERVGQSTYDIEKIKDEIEKILLLEQDIEEIKRVVNSKKSSKFTKTNLSKLEAYTYLYKLRFICNAPMMIIGDFFNLTPSGMWRKMKAVGWCYPMEEAHKLSSQVRDYSNIRIKSKKTLLENNTLLVGSSPENYVRHKLNIDIPLKLPDAEVIVGVNNQSILKDGYEVDIPIIILYKNNIYKYAVEVDGDYWHSSEIRIQKDMEKQKELSLSDYKMFRVIQTTYSSVKNIYGSIDEQIENISNSITNQVLYSLTL